MSRLSELLLLTLNNLAPDTHQSLLQAKHDPFTYQSFFANRSHSSFVQFGELDLTGLNVLDVGCGLGANLVYLCQSGAASVTGLDISVEQALCTQEMMHGHYPEWREQVRFVGANAARMPFGDNSFDVLVAADTFEHVAELELALQECNRVLRPGGFLYAYFPPFYAPWGAHLVNWIRLPWCQVLFSEETILNVARKLEAEGKSVNSQFPPETRLDLGSGNVIPFVSHLTVHRFERIVKGIPNWQMVKVALLPPNWRTNSPGTRLLQPLNRVPVLQEIFTAKATYVIQKH